VALFLFSRSLFWLQNRLDIRQTEGPERDVDEAVGAEDNDKTDETPENRLPPFGALCFIPRLPDKLKYAPKKDHKSGARKKEDNRVDYLDDNSPEVLVELNHLLRANVDTCFRCTASYSGIIAETHRPGKNINKPPDRNHNEETDEAIDHEILTLLFYLLIISADDESVKRSPKEDNESNREKYRNEHIVYGVDNE
jgi:hypothetical protein